MRPDRPNEEKKMPRFENDGPEVQKWNRETGDGSSTWDFCAKCAKLVAGKSVKAAGVDCYNGDPDGVVRGEDVGHPDYADEDYRCERCNKKLTAQDD